MDFYYLGQIEGVIVVQAYFNGYVMGFPWDLSDADMAFVNSEPNRVVLRSRASFDATYVPKLSNRRNNGRVVADFDDGRVLLFEFTSENKKIGRPFRAIMGLPSDNVLTKEAADELSAKAINGSVWCSVNMTNGSTVHCLLKDDTPLSTRTLSVTVPTADGETIRLIDADGIESISLIQPKSDRYLLRDTVNKLFVAHLTFEGQQRVQAESERETREALIIGGAIVLYGVFKYAELAIRTDAQMRESGYVLTKRLGSCSNCGGNGKVFAVLGEVTCRRCGGSGLHDEPTYVRKRPPAP